MGGIRWYTPQIAILMGKIMIKNRGTLGTDNLELLPAVPRCDATPDWKVRRWRKVMLLRGSLGSLDHQSRYLLALSSKDIVPGKTPCLADLCPACTKKTI